VEWVVVRSFGSVAAVAAAALALMIGFLAFSAHSKHDADRPPAGSQAAGPTGGRLVNQQAPAGPAELAASQARANEFPQSAPAPAPQSSANFVTFGGSSGGQAAASSSAASCSPGLIASVVGLVGALLGGGGASC
jgi:hypothetical protein